MTIQDVSLTEQEVIAAITDAALGKLGLSGEYRVEIRVKHTQARGVVGADCTVIPLKPGTLPGPPRLVFAPGTLAEAAAGPDGEVARGAR